MRKSLILVGLLGFLLMPSMAQAVPSTVETAYCMAISASDTYVIVTQDIYFTNSSAYGYVCFRQVGGVVDNVTIDFNGSTLYVNSTNTAAGVFGSFATNWTIKDGTIDLTAQIYGASDGFTFNWANNADIYIDNMTVIGAVTGLKVTWASAKRVTVYDSSFTGSSTYDLDLELPQSEITSCGNTWNTFRPAHSILSKDSCEDPPASYKDYIRLVNCTQHSSTAYGALVCSNEIYIPPDCVNITTEAWTVISVQNETYMNSNTSFTRWTCNPEGDRITHCDNLFKTCTYYNLNAYPSRRWDDYAAGQNATSFHISSIPMGCLENSEGGNFSMIGRLYLACKSFTESGIVIDGQEENCTHELLCFNSDTMEERFADCTSILTPCTYGCVEGVCLSVATTTLPTEAELDPLLDLSLFPGATWVSMLFTPFSIITMMLVGIGAYFENQVQDAKGGIFLAVIIVGVLAFSYLGLYPVWIGVLIAILCAGILTKLVMKLW